MFSPGSSCASSAVPSGLVATCALDGSIKFSTFTRGVPALGQSGLRLSAAGGFPAGANISFAEPTEAGYRVRIYERGVGWTEACGSAACAVSSVALRLGERDRDARRDSTGTASEEYH